MYQDRHDTLFDESRGVRTPRLALHFRETSAAWDILQAYQGDVATTVRVLPPPVDGKLPQKRITQKRRSEYNPVQ